MRWAQMEIMPMLSRIVVACEGPGFVKWYELGKRVGIGTR